MTATAKIRKPAVAGMFYPEDPEDLRSMVDTLLAAADPVPPEGRIAGFILPHAGYPYSGLTAAYGYKLLASRMPDTVVIISPSHREYFNGISVYDGDEFLTPLGSLTIDRKLRDRLTATEPRIRPGENGHRREHAIEVHLPFLQRLGGRPAILPIVMGDQNRTWCFLLGEALAATISGSNTVVIASSDLSHYHSADEAGRLDAVIERDIADGDYERLMRNLESGRTEACGGGPAVSTLLAAARLGAQRTRILHRCHSGDVTGDDSSVVGYLSAVIHHSSS